MSNLTAAVVDRVSVKKLLLWCRHAEELSQRCVLALRAGCLEPLEEMQRSKDTIIAELIPALQALHGPEPEELREAAQRLRHALQVEADAVEIASAALQRELLALGSAQTRVTYARSYDSASRSGVSSQGSVYSACG